MSIPGAPWRMATFRIILFAQFPLRVADRTTVSASFLSLARLSSKVLLARGSRHGYPIPLVVFSNVHIKVLH
jgi:hypothetical protein